MRIYTAVIEKCMDTGLYVGFVPGFSGAHSQGETLDELNENLKEVIASNRDISPILLRQIAKDIDLTIDEFIRNR